MLHHKEILPLITVTKNPFKDIEKTFNFFKKSENDGFSKVAMWQNKNAGNIVAYRTGFMGSIKLDDDSVESQVLSEIIEIEQKVLNDYIDMFKKNDIWNNSIEKIDPNTFDFNNIYFDLFIYKGSIFDKSNPVRTLGFHVDAKNGPAENNTQHIITNMFYLNDDYECGEIEFFYFDNVDNEYKILSYKPSAGDVVTFPSFYPYFHAARAPYLNDRYIIRTSYNNIFDDLIERNKITFIKFFGSEQDVNDYIKNNRYIYLDGKNLWRNIND